MKKRGNLVILICCAFFGVFAQAADQPQPVPSSIPAVASASLPASTPAPEAAAQEAEAPVPPVSENPSQVLGDDQIMFKDMFEQVQLEAKRPYQKPNYTRQETALGYVPEAFSVPAGMEQRVAFWIDVFTKINSDQGYLHDAIYPYIVYEVVDFSDIMRDQTISDRQRMKARERRVNEARRRVKQRLAALDRIRDPGGVKGEDLRYWYMFGNIDEPRKFRAAQQNSRMRFQLGLKDRFVKGIYLSGRYIQDMEKTFRDMGLPTELTRLPFVESSFNTKARSRVGASGIWQFMRYTGRESMRMNASVDERNDPLRATVSAAKKLKGNFEMLGSWPLAITGYNHGPSGVKRLVRRYGTANIVELVEKRKGRFGFASANFYASFLAALIVERDAQRFFGEVFWQPPLQGHEIVLNKTIDRDDLLAWFRGDIELAKEFNMHINRSVWEGHVRLGQGNFVRVPVYSREIAMADLEKVPDKPLFRSKFIQVGHGDTLESIAKTYGVRLREILAANEGLNPRRLRPGQKIYVPH